MVPEHRTLDALGKRSGCISCICGNHAPAHAHTGAVCAGNRSGRSLCVAGRQAADGAGMDRCRAFPVSAWRGTCRSGAGHRVPPGGCGQRPQHAGLRSCAAGGGPDAGRCASHRRHATTAGGTHPGAAAPGLSAGEAGLAVRSGPLSLRACARTRRAGRVDGHAPAAQAGRAAGQAIAGWPLARLGGAGQSGDRAGRWWRAQRAQPRWQCG